MSKPPASDEQGTSTRPYLIRALHDWCTDNGFTPYIAVFVSQGVQVPMEYVKNNEIVLNIGFEATSGMKLGNDFIEFRARFGGVARDIMVPVDHVVAIYARENGQGMAFPAPTPGGVAGGGATTATPAEDMGSDHRASGLRLATPADLAPEAGDGADEAEVTDPAVPSADDPSSPVPPNPPHPPQPTSPGGRPALKRIK